MEEQTVMEYAVANRLSVSHVQKAANEGRVAARKSGKRWLIPAGAVIASKGEKAEVVPIGSSDKAQVKVGAVATTEQDTEEDEMDREAAKVEREIALLDKRKDAVEKKLQLDGHITWDEFQKQQAELKQDKEAVRVSEAQVSTDRATIDKRELSLDNWERRIKGGVGELDKWLHRVDVLGKKAKEIIADFVATITYDKGLAEQYMIDERHPNWTDGGKMLSMQGVRYRLEDLVKLISDFANLPEPDFSIAEEDDEEELDSEMFDSDDEQEQDEVDAEQVIEAVGKAVDEEVAKEFVQDTAVDVPAIIKPRRSKKQDGD